MCEKIIKIELKIAGLKYISKNIVANGVQPLKFFDTSLKVKKRKLCKNKIHVGFKKGKGHKGKLVSWG